MLVRGEQAKGEDAVLQNVKEVLWHQRGVQKQVEASQTFSLQPIAQVSEKILQAKALTP